MLMVLLGAGIALLLVGLGALGYGIPYKEFGFGNTLIIAGAGAACPGFLMIGLWAVARELQHISRWLGSGAVASAQPVFPAEPPWAPALNPQPLPPRAAAEDAHVDPGAAPPWMEGRGDEPPPPPPAEAAQKPRRNLLFTSTSRKERERAAARASEPLAPDLLSADLRPNPPAMDAPPVEPMMPTAPSPPSFEAAW